VEPIPFSGAASVHILFRQGAAFHHRHADYIFVERVQMLANMIKECTNAYEDQWLQQCSNRFVRLRQLRVDQSNYERNKDDSVTDLAKPVGRPT